MTAGETVWHWFPEPEGRKVFTMTSRHCDADEHSECVGLLWIERETDLPIQPEWIGQRAMCKCPCHLCAGSGN